jgi:hypothetical protein
MSEYDQLMSLPADSNLTIFEARKGVLMVDLDEPGSEARMKQALSILKIDDQPRLSTVSKSGLPHQHVYIQCPRSWSWHRMFAAQACLGSDFKREGLSLTRRRPSCLVETPAEAARVRAWLRELDVERYVELLRLGGWVAGALFMATAVAIYVLAVQAHP